MANKRDLKRSLNYSCSQLFAECVASYLCTDKAEHDTVDATLTSILRVHSDFVRRVSHPEPGMKPKAYYKRLIEDFNQTAGELIDQIAALE